MKKRTKLILVCAVLLILGIAGWCWKASYHIDLTSRYHGGKNRLYYRTDYYALREACMTVITNRYSYLHWEEVEDATRWGRGVLVEGSSGTGPIALDPNDPALPPILLEFKLSALVVTESRLAAHPYHGPPSCSHYCFVVFLDENNITDTNMSDEELDFFVGMSSADTDQVLVPNDKVWVKIIDNLWLFDADSFLSGFGPSRDEAIQIFRKQVAKQEEERTRE